MAFNRTHTRGQYRPPPAPHTLPEEAGAHTNFNLSVIPCTRQAPDAGAVVVVPVSGGFGAYHHITSHLAGPLPTPPPLDRAQSNIMLQVCNHILACLPLPLQPRNPRL